MDSVTLLAEARKAGLEVTTDGERLIVRGPKQAEPVARQLLAHKAEVMAVLQEAPVDACATPAPLGKVGRHGAPCPQCGDTWQWPTTAGAWVCSWCFVGDPQTAPRFADDGTLLSACAH
jgi:hypothetical protein